MDVDGEMFGDGMDGEGQPGGFRGGMRGRGGVFRYALCDQFDHLKVLKNHLQIYRPRGPGDFGARGPPPMGPPRFRGRGFPGPGGPRGPPFRGPPPPPFARGRFRAPFDPNWGPMPPHGMPPHMMGGPPAASVMSFYLNYAAGLYNFAVNF